LGSRSDSGRQAAGAFRAADLPKLDDVHLNVSVLAFTIFLGVLTTLVFGLVPALAARRVAPVDALREGGRDPKAAKPRHAQRARVAEITLAVILLAGAGLLIRSFGQLTKVDPDFPPRIF